MGVGLCFVERLATKTAMKYIVRGQPNSSTYYPSDEIPSVGPTEVGFPVSVNQFNVLSKLESLVSQSHVQEEVSLINPRSKRLQRLQAARRSEDQGTPLKEGVSQNTIPQNTDDLAFVTHYLFVLPIDILESHSVGNFEQRTSDIQDAMYDNAVKEVNCIKDLTCNKRISNAGQEWLVGRLGNWPIGARNTAHNFETCFGPYAILTIVHPPHMGRNTHDSR